MKTAICIFGQLRTFDNYKLQELFNVNIIDVLRPDIFIATWNNRGHSAYSAIAGIDIKNTNEIVSLDSIVGVYNPEDVIQEDYNIWLNSLPKHVQDMTICDKGSSIPQAYKMWQAVNMKQQYENKRNFKYDAVILCRPDVIFFNRFHDRCLNDLNSLWTMNCLTACSWERNTTWPKRIYGVVEISNSINIDYLANIYNCYNQYLDIDSGNGLTRYDMCRLLYLHYITKTNAKIRSYIDRTFFEVLRSDRDFNNSDLPEDRDIRERQQKIKSQIENNEKIEDIKDIEVLNWLIHNEYIEIINNNLILKDM